MIPIVSIVGEDELTNQISYPVYDGRTLSVEGGQPIIRNIKVLDAETVFDLGYNGTFSSVAPKSLQDVKGNTYSVSSGKTAKVIVILRCLTASTTIQLIEDASADSGAGTVKATTISLSTNDIVTLVFDGIAATKFVTLKAVTAAKNCAVESAVAIETAT